MSDGPGLGSARGSVEIDAAQALATLDRLESRMTALSASSRGLGTSLAAAGAASRTAEQGFEQASRKIDEAAQRSASWKQNLATVSDGLAKLAVPAAAAGAAAGVMAGKFDDALRNVNSIAKLTDDQLGALGQEFLNLSNSSNVIRDSAGKLADGFYELQSSGFGLANGGMKVLEQSAIAATAGMTSTAVASKAIAAGLNAYGLEADQAGRVSDALFRTVDLGVTTFEEMAGSIGRVLPNANALDVSIEQVGAAIATMTKAGLSGSQAVTNLNSLFSSLVKPTKEASDAAAEYGINLSLLGRGDNGFVELLQEINEKTGGNVEAISKLIGSQEGLNAALTLSSEGAKSYIADLEQMQQATGATLSAAEERSKSTGAAMQELRKAFENAAITAGSQLTPTIRDVAGALTDMVQAFNALPPDEQQRYVKIAGAVGAMVIGLFGAVKAVQGLVVVVESAQAAYNLYTKAAGAAATATRGFSAASVASAAAVALPLAAIGGLVYLYADLQNAIGQATAELDKALPVYVRTADLQRQIQELGVATPTAVGVNEQINSLYERRATLLRDIALEEQTMGWFGDATGQRTERVAAYNAELKTIENTLGGLNTALEREIGLTQQQAAMQDYRAGERESLTRLTEAHEALAPAIQLTAEEQEAFNKLLSENSEEGRDALRDVVQGQLDGIKQLRDARTDYEEKTAQAAAEHQRKMESLQQDLAGATTAKQRESILERIAEEQHGYDEMAAAAAAGYAEQERLQAVSYAQQQAAQVAHLGQLLLERVAALRETGELSDQEADEIARGIQDKFGVLPDTVGQAYDEMAAKLQNFADTAEGSTSGLVAEFGVAQDEAVETKQRMDELTGEYTAELVQNFNDGKIDAEDLTKALQEVPARVLAQIDVENAAARARLKEVDIDIAEIPKQPHIEFSDNAPATKGKVDDLTGSVNNVPAGKAITFSTNADDIRQRIANIQAATNSIPPEIMVRINATIDPNLVRRSPAPIEQVIATIEKAAKDPKRIKVAAEGAESIEKIVSALEKLQAYEPGKLVDSTIEGFKGDTSQMLAALADVLSQFDAKVLEKAGAFAEDATKVASLVAAGADALNKLAERKGGIDREAIGEFKLDIERIVRELVLMSAVFEAEGVKAAAEFSENAVKVLQLASSGVDAITALTEYRPAKLTQSQLLSFSSNLSRILTVLDDLARQFEQEGTAQAATFAKAAREVLALVSDGVKAIDSLVTYQTGRSYDQQLTGLAYDLRRVIFVLEDLAQQFEQEGLDAAAAFAKSAGDVLGLVADGVEAFSALDESKPLDVKAFDTLAANIELAVAKIVEMAQRIDRDLLPQTVEFAEAADKILKPIATAVATFEKVNDYKGVAVDAFKLLAQDMVGVVGHMVALSAQLRTEGYPAAVEFSETSESVFGGLKAGLDFLTAVSEYEGDAPAKFGVFQNDFLAALEMATVMATDSGRFVDASQVWKDNLGTAADNFRDGVDSLLGLNGISVNLQASISAQPVAQSTPEQQAAQASMARLGTQAPAQSGASGAYTAGSGGATTTFDAAGGFHVHVHGDMNIRDEMDIKLVARELNDLQRADRRRGA